MKITLIGYGKMGHMIADIAKERGHEIAATIDTFAKDASVTVPQGDAKAVAKAVKDVKAGKIEYKLDKANIIHVIIGKVSFGADKLKENFDAVVNAIVKAKPSAAKGQYLKSVVIASTMGPGIKINPVGLS